MEVRSYVTQYYGPQTPDYYNQFFHPNVCHVCKWCRRSRLILCDRCCMISYCSEEHQAEHYAQHKSICESVAKLLGQESRYDTSRYDFFEWVRSKEALVQAVKLDLGRQLLPYEAQMLMYRKACLICYQETGLRTCRQCYSADFCNKHATEFHAEHRSSCKELMLSLNLNIVALCPYVSTIKLKLAAFPNARKPLRNTLSFISRYLSIPMLYTKTSMDWIEKQLIYSDYASGPLTLYHGLKKANVLYSLRRELFVVHVIAANTVDDNSLPTWEILLHLIGDIEKLIVVMIGPELQFDSYDHKVCHCCQRRNKKMSYECHSMLYHHYVSSPEYKRPTVIVGFQAELNNGETWSESIMALQAQGCPLLLTAKFPYQMQEDLIKIQFILGTNIRPVLETVNKFSALRPYRELRSNEIFYRNKYLTIFKDLMGFRQPIGDSSDFG